MYNKMMIRRKIWQFISLELRSVCIVNGVRSKKRKYLKSDKLHDDM